MAKDYDPQMHTAEHVLNQSMVRLFGCGRCFSSHLNPGKSKCDYHFPRALSDEEAASIERVVNETLAKNLSVTEKSVPRSEAEKLVNLGKLPPSVGPDAPIRIVAVGVYDLCPCIGAHVANPRHAGTFRPVPHAFQPGATPDPGVLRVRLKPDNGP
mgnify:CR=1 FL=1